MWERKTNPLRNMGGTSIRCPKDHTQLLEQEIGMGVGQLLVLENFNVHHRLLVFRANMVPFPRSYILECSSTSSAPSCLPTSLLQTAVATSMRTPEFSGHLCSQASGHLDNHCPTMTGLTGLSIIPWRSPQQPTAAHSPQPYC